MITWVAEIGSAHKGEKSLAYEMIRRYAEAGAGIIKFQFGWTEAAQIKHITSRSYPPFRYVDDWAPDLARWCESFGVELMASIWSEEGLQAARAVNMKRYKISHQVWKNDSDLAKMIILDRKPVFISGLVQPIEKTYTFLYCSPQYPTYPDALKMPEKFGPKYQGYSDHSHGIEACLLAVSRGALYVEKHCALDKADLTVRDTPFSATPEEFAEMVRIGNGMRRLLDAGA